MRRLLRRRRREDADTLDAARRRHWPEAAAASGGPRACNICGWSGDEFDGQAHCESAVCPICGSIGRDRFLFWCWMAVAPPSRMDAVLETSPRLDDRYRSFLAEVVRYTSSDFDLSAHRGAIQLDLQSIDLPTASVDVVLTPHVLEHVPDTEAALGELHRVLRPGGHLLLQVPVPHGRTAPPMEPEYHGDNTLVHWRFGWDLAERIAAVGFRCDVLVTEELRRVAASGGTYDYRRADFDVDDLMAHAAERRLVAIADEATARRLGFEPAFQFVTFHGRR